MHQVVSNLIRSAIAYTPAGGRIDVQARIDEARSAWVITVADTGIGISESDTPYVFDAFFRSTDDDHTRVRGTGLGLAIARLLVGEHGGSIRVDSRVGVGTTLTVRLPFRGL